MNLSSQQEWVKIGQSLCNVLLLCSDKTTNSYSTRKPSPWMTGDIMQLMHERDILHKRATKSRKHVDWELYKSSRNNINILIRKRKQSYFSNKIFTDSSNKHNLWKSLFHLESMVIIWLKKHLQTVLTSFSHLFVLI